MSPGAKVAIWASVTVSVLVVVIIVIVVIVSTRGDQGDPAIVNGRGNYTVQLGPNGRDVRSVKFTAGRRVRITVASDRQINVQLAVFDPQGRLISQGVGAFGGGHSQAEFRPPRSGLYRIEVVNFGPERTRSVVTCD